MAFYSELLAGNSSGTHSFDDDVLRYPDATVELSPDTLPDGGIPVTVGLSNGISVEAVWYRDGLDPVVLITAGQLVQLPEVEQELIKEYEQCPTENPENPGRRLGVVRPRRVLL